MWRGAVYVTRHSYPVNEGSSALLFLRSHRLPARQSVYVNENTVKRLFVSILPIKIASILSWVIIVKLGYHRNKLYFIFEELSILYSNTSNIISNYFFHFLKTETFLILNSATCDSKHTIREHVYRGRDYGGGNISDNLHVPLVDCWTEHFLHIFVSRHDRWW